jgi:hypothetical protein
VCRAIENPDIFTQNILQTAQIELQHRGVETNVAQRPKFEFPHFLASKKSIEVSGRLPTTKLGLVSIYQSIN